ncbi:TIGR04282 family arsenosugar biosynthesis glycosyltransferase [Neptunomonas phycophila]|uniref:TIGR04282 family arsenosugar biosynthesis glycosyltransferase n=1 Tax=Neptunomonas phycophila TaxID=1572645 RepID=UPI0037356B50
MKPPTLARDTTLVIFAKAPKPGLAKTRLIPALGKKGAAHLADLLLQNAVKEALATSFESIELCVTPDMKHPYWSSLIADSRIQLTQQVDGHLGERMSATAKRIIDKGRSVILTGTDCPPLTTQRLLAAASALEQHDSVIYPVEDGGYSLLGIQQWHPSLFSDIPWSTDAVANITLNRLKHLQWSCWEGELLWDVDTPNDLSRLPSRFESPVISWSLK